MNRRACGGGATLAVRMTRESVGIVTVWMLVLFGSTPVYAQTGGLGGRLSIQVNAAVQSSSEKLGQTFSRRVYGEDAVFDVLNDIKGGAVLDTGGSVRVWRHLSVGAAYTELNQLGTTTVTGTVPHPILFNANRAIDPVMQSLPHRERVTHIFAAWRVPVRQVKNLNVSVFGGPSYMNLTQRLVTDVGVAEGGGTPFSAVRVTAVPVAEHTSSAWGGHVGVDVIYMVTSIFGVGALVRYSNGSVDIPSSNDDMLSVTVGGLQAGGGIRLRF